MAAGVLALVGFVRYSHSEKKPNIGRLVNDLLGRPPAFELTRKLAKPSDYLHPKYDNNPLGLHYKYYFDPDDLRKFKGWIEETTRLSVKSKSCAIVVDKAAYEVFLFKSGRLIKTISMELGANPYDDKMMQGDRATPEGRYSVKRILWKSEFYRALLINYPNAHDKKAFQKRLRKKLIPPKQGIGSAIEIHGHGKGLMNWTWGCVAVNDEAIDELFRFVRKKCIKKGTPVTIVRYGMKLRY